MNLDGYIRGLERTAVEVPKLLAERETIDLDLWEQYSEQLTWMLDAQEGILVLARTVGRYDEIRSRMRVAIEAMLPHAPAVDETMGVQIALHHDLL